MTRHRTEFAREGSGYVFNTERTRKMAGRLSRVASQNAKRVPCAKCGLMILPGALHVHMDIVHGDES